jgi:hypothetical protein
MLCCGGERGESCIRGQQMQDNGLGQGVGKDGMMFGETLLIGSLVDVDHGEVSKRWIDIMNEFSSICYFSFICRHSIYTFMYPLHRILIH